MYYAAFSPAKYEPADVEVLSGKTQKRSLPTGFSFSKPGAHSSRTDSPTLNLDVARSSSAVYLPAKKAALNNTFSISIFFFASEDIGN